jgi:hypothetical protein
VGAVAWAGLALRRALKEVEPLQPLPGAGLRALGRGLGQPLTVSKKPSKPRSTINRQQCRCVYETGCELGLNSAATVCFAGLNPRQARDSGSSGKARTMRRDGGWGPTRATGQISTAVW